MRVLSSMIIVSTLMAQDSRDTIPRYLLVAPAGSSLLLPKPSFEWTPSPFAKIQGGVLTLSTVEPPVGVDVRGPLISDKLHYSTGIYGFKDPGLWKAGYIVRSNVTTTPLELRNAQTVWHVGLNVNHIYGSDIQRRRPDERMIVGSNVMMEWRNWEIRKIAGINVSGRRQALVYDTSLDYALAQRSHIFLRWTNFSPGLWQLQSPSLNLGIRLGGK